MDYTRAQTEATAMKQETADEMPLTIDGFLNQFSTGYKYLEDEKKNKVTKKFLADDSQKAIGRLAIFVPEIQQMAPEDQMELMTSLISNTKIDRENNRRRKVSGVINTVVRPVANGVGFAGGAAIGATVGAGGGTLAMPVAGTIAGAGIGASAGAGVGYAASNQLVNALEQEFGQQRQYDSMPQMWGEQLKEMALDTGMGMAGDAAAPYVGRAIGAGVNAAGKGGRAIINTALKPVGHLTRKMPNSQAVAAAAERHGIPLMREEISGSTAASLTGKSFENQVFTGDIAAKAKQIQREGMDAAVDRTKALTGGRPMSYDEAAEGLINSREANYLAQKKYFSNAYDEIGGKTAGYTVKPQNTLDALDKIAAKYGDTFGSESKAIKEYAPRILSREEGSYNALKQLRTEIRDKLKDPGITTMGTQYEGELKLLRQGLTEDITALTRKAGVGDDILNLNKEFAVFRHAFDNKKLLAEMRKDPAKLMDALLSPKAQASINRVKNTSSKPEWDDFALAGLEKMFEESGQFGFSNTHKWFPKYRSSLEAILGKDSPILKDLEDYALISKRFQDVAAKGGNPSGTARQLGVMATAALGGASLINPTFLPYLIAKIVGERVLAKWWYSSPTLRKMLLDVAKNPQTITKPVVYQTVGQAIHDNAGRAGVSEFNNHIKRQYPGGGISSGNIPKPNMHTDDAAKNIARAVGEQPDWRYYNRPDLRQLKVDDFMDAPALIQPAASRKEAVNVMKKALGFKGDESAISIKTPIKTIKVESKNIPHMVEKVDNAREQYANFIRPTLEEPFEIYTTKYSDGSIRHRYIGLFKGKTNMLVVVNEMPDGSFLWNIMNADVKRLNKLRVGELIYTKK